MGKRNDEVITAAAELADDNHNYYPDDDLNLLETDMSFIDSLLDTTDAAAVIPPDENATLLDTTSTTTKDLYEEGSFLELLSDPLDVTKTTTSTSPPCPSFETILSQVQQTLDQSNSTIPPRREWDSWTQDEMSKFFNGIKKMTSKTMGNKNSRFSIISKKIGSKTESQVSQLFYRLLKKINDLLKPYDTQVTHKDYDDIRIALMSWCHVVLSTSNNFTIKLDNPVTRKRFAKSLYQMLTKIRKSLESRKKLSSTTTPTTIHNPTVKRKRTHNESETTNAKKLKLLSDNSNSVCEVSSDGTSPKMTLRFCPIDVASKNKILKAGLKPQYELKLSSSKKISSVVSHLSAKWKDALSEEQEQSLVIVPLGDRIHPGWTVNDISVTCMDIIKNKSKLCTYRPVTLEYKIKTCRTITKKKVCTKKKRIKPTFVPKSNGSKTNSNPFEEM